MAFLLAGSVETRHLALIGNFLPRKCGIATYTTDTYNALKARFPDMRVDVYAMDDRPGAYDYPPEVTRSIPQNERLAYLEAGRAIEASGAQAVWLQHEYGIFGGAAGDLVLALLDRVSVPLIVTLHTVLEQPSPDERRVLEALLKRASRVVVMAEKGREILARVYRADPRKVVMIPHGVAFEHRGDAPFAGLGHDDPFGCVAFDRAGDLAGKSARVVGIVQRDVIHCPSKRAQSLGMVSHRGENEGDLLLVVADISRFLGDLHHQHHRLGRIDVVERGDTGRELIAQDRDQDRHCRRSIPHSPILHRGP